MVRISAVHRETHILKLASYYDFFEHIAHMGIRKVGQRLVENAHEAYISRPDFDLVQGVMQAGKFVRIRRRPTRQDKPFHLIGRMFCGHCGAPIWLEGDGRALSFARLRCSRKQKNGASCELASLSYRPFLATLIAKLRGKLPAVERIEAVITEMNRQRGGSRGDVAAERRRLGKEIAALDRSTLRLVDAVEAGQGAAAGERLRQREAERAELQGRLVALAVRERRFKPYRISRGVIERLVGELGAALESSDPDTLKSALGALIRRIDIHNDRAVIDATTEAAAVLLFPDATSGVEPVPAGGFEPPIFTLKG